MTGPRLVVIIAAFAGMIALVAFQIQAILKVQWCWPREALALRGDISQSLLDCRSAILMLAGPQGPMITDQNGAYSLPLPSSEEHNPQLCGQCFVLFISFHLMYFLKKYTSSFLEQF